MALWGIKNTKDQISMFNFYLLNLYFSSLTCFILDLKYRVTHRAIWYPHGLVFWLNFWCFFVFFSKTSLNFKKMLYIPYKSLERGYLIFLWHRLLLPLKDCHTLESQHRTFFIKINMLGFGAKLLPILNVEWIHMF